MWILEHKIICEIGITFQLDKADPEGEEQRVQDPGLGKNHVQCKISASTLITGKHLGGEGCVGQGEERGVGWEGFSKGKPEGWRGGGHSATAQVCAAGREVPSLEPFESRHHDSFSQALAWLLGLHHVLSLGGPKEADDFIRTFHRFLNIVCHRSLFRPPWTKSSVPREGPRVGCEWHQTLGQWFPSQGPGSREAGRR